jgi:hypothetical protein
MLTPPRHRALLLLLPLPTAWPCLHRQHFADKVGKCQRLHEWQHITSGLITVTLQAS